MPYSARVNHQTRTITLVCWDDITIDDMMEYERRYWGGPEHEGFHHVIDLLFAKLAIDLNEGLMLATHATPSDPNAYRGARSAIVVADEETEILALAYRDARHSMCSPATREIEVFSRLDDAVAWIEDSQVVYASA